MSKFSYCGTDRACRGCPLAEVEPMPIGTFNVGFQEAETVGEAVERLHDNGQKFLSHEAAFAVLVSLNVGSTERDITKLQAAVERQATPECTPTMLIRSRY